MFANMILYKLLGGFQRGLEIINLLYTPYSPSALERQHHTSSPIRQPSSHARRPIESDSRISEYRESLGDFLFSVHLFD